ncbi:F0F1 ATP synthase subunit B [Patescibacteria group bacterium]|nr:F0F1 ATP synthase subunit B [Patescibacteria group bacterium]
MGLIQALGIDGRILLAQFLNFAVLVFVLWRFAYKPVFKILEERRLKIEKGLDDADTAAKSLLLTEEENKQLLIKARQEASVIIENAQKQADLRQQAVVGKAEEEIAAITEKERAKISAEKEAIMSQLKNEVSSLVLAGLQQFLSENMTDKRDQEVVSKIVNNLEK